jgi:hypothetical protein
MLRRGEDLRGRAKFNDLAGVENKDAVGEAVEKEGIVRDQEKGKAESIADLAEKLKDFALGGGIERGRRFVGDEESGLASDSLHDEDALTLAAAEFVRIRTGDTWSVVVENGCENLRGLVAQSGTRQRAVGGENVADLLADAKRGVQRRGRLLKDEANAGAANRFQITCGGREKIFILEKDGAALEDGVGREKVKERGGEGAFAGARFAQDTEDFARRESEIDSSQSGAETARRRSIGDAEIFNLQQGCHGFTGRDCHIPW